MPRRRRPTPPAPIHPPVAFALPAEGPGITDEHRLTGFTLETHWSTLGGEVLREIRRLVHEGVGQDGD